MSSQEVKPKRKKSKKFGFKGLVRRKSKKEKVPSAPGAPATEEDDSTVYSVAFDAASKLSESQGASLMDSVKEPAGDPIHIILLLMDPNTRRFELLQLEFDSSTSKVSDIFGQIAVSATEPSLKSQKYKRLTNMRGEELISSKNIAEYMDSAGIVIAVPSTTKEKGAAIVKMASPILSNPKVHSMLTSSGLDIADLPAAEIKAPAKEDVTPPTPVVEPVPVVAALVPAPAAKSAISFFGIAVLAIVVHLILKVDMHYTSPFGPGDALAPGRTRGRCGISGFNPWSPCEASTILMGENGVLQVIKGGEVVYEITGKVCGSDDCVAGLAIDEEGIVKIGGERVKVIKEATVDLQPWPFAEDVVVPEHKHGLFGNKGKK